MAKSWEHLANMASDRTSRKGSPLEEGHIIPIHKRIHQGLALRLSTSGGHKTFDQGV